jgi:hypothetical protein
VLSASPPSATRTPRSPRRSLRASDPTTGALHELRHSNRTRRLRSCCGRHSATATDGLKYDLTALDADTAEGIRKATLAQAEFRNHVGPDYFLDLPGTTVQGPDFTITTGGPGAASGWSKYLGSKTLAELASYGLLRATARARP